MRAPAPFRRPPPTMLERLLYPLLGRRRVRRLRRRLGLVALGTGVTLVKPAIGWARLGVVMASTAAAAVVLLAWR